MNKKAIYLVYRDGVLVKQSAWTTAQAIAKALADAGHRVTVERIPREVE